MSLNLPNIYVQSINQQYTQLTKNKKEYEYTDNLINLYKTQFEKYDKIKSRTSKLAMNDEIANKLTKFVNNTRHTFDEKTLKLTTYLDNRITNDDTWCIRNKLNYLGNDIYYVQYKDGKCFFGCKITENIVSFNLIHLDKIKSEIKIAIQNLKEKLVELKKEITLSIDKIDDIIKGCKIKDTLTLKRKQEKITENSNKIKHYNEILERITNENNKLKEDELDIQKNIINNDLYLLNINKKFMVNN